MSEPLTPSEEISMQQLARGLTAHQAARERYISHKTVKSQLSQAYRKLGARNGPHAVAIWLTTQRQGDPV